jgi:oligoendopeptidase F
LGGERGTKTRGGSRPLPELFSAAGCKFQFDAVTIKPLIQLASTELKKL